jgi:hypothetical protein
MVEAIRGIASQRRPSEARIPDLLSGLATIVGRMNADSPIFAAAGE